MNEELNAWQRLAQQARQAPSLDEPTAPFGFATRVAARWTAGGEPATSGWEVWEQWAMRSLLVGGALMVAAVFASAEVATPGWTQQYTLAEAVLDPIALFEE